MAVTNGLSNSTETVISWIQHLPPVWSTLIQVGVAFILTLIISGIVLFISSRIYRHLKKTHNIWDDILLEALHKPLQVVIWLYGLLYMIQLLVNLYPNFLYNQGFDVARDLIAILAIVWFLVRYIKLFELRISEASQRKRRVDKATTFAISKLLRIGVVLVAVLVVLQIVGVPITGLVAFGGAGVLVTGLAAKDLLANFFGGIMIYTDRPFTVGDWISSPDRKIEGTVERIGWRLTRIRTFDRRPMFVPNSLFSSIIVVNPSRMYNRRILTNIGLRYDDIGRVRGIQQDITAMLQNHPEIDQNQILIVRFHEYGASSINLQVYTFTKTTEWLKFMEIQEDVFLQIADIVAKHGAEFAFPTQTLEVPKGLTITETQKTGD